MLCGSVFCKSFNRRLCHIWIKGVNFVGEGLFVDSGSTGITYPAAHQNRVLTRHPPLDPSLFTQRTPSPPTGQLPHPEDIGAM